MAKPMPPWLPIVALLVLVLGSAASGWALWNATQSWWLSIPGGFVGGFVLAILIIRFSYRPGGMPPPSV
jgi:hypothetical protein